MKDALFERCYRFLHPRRACALAALAGLIACGPSAARSPESIASGAASAVDPITVRVTGERFSMRGDVIDDASRKPMTQNAIMTSGEGYSLKVDLSRPARVYLLQLHATGGSEILYPSGADPRGASARHAIPSVESHDVLTLDHETGTEVLLLIVSERPLTSAAPELAAAIREIETAAPNAILPFTIRMADEAVAAPVASESPGPTNSETRPAGPNGAGPSPVPSVEPKAGPVPYPPSRSSACAPVVVLDALPLTARGPCPGAKRPPLELKAKGSVRKRVGAELINAIADTSGVVSYPIKIDHR